MARKQRRVTLRSQWLGRMLRELREQNGLTLREASEYLQKDLSSISKFELGTFPIRRGDVFALIDLYGVDDRRQRETLLQLTDEVWQTGWWEKYSGNDVWGATIDLVWLEDRAESMVGFSALTVPGLLQTPDYANSLMRAANRDASPHQLSRWVELRMKRQGILEKEGPVRFSVVLDEAALRRPAGGRSVMREQFRHLLRMVELPHVDIRVLPFEAGAHASPDGAFHLIKMADPFPEVAHVESPGGAMYLETGEAERLRALYDRLQESSLDAQDSAAFIAALEKDSP